MSEFSALDSLRAINATAPFNRWMGLEVVDASRGHAEIRMKWRPEAAQYAGFLHAGLIGALIDTACGFAAATLGRRVMASHFQVNCMAPGVGAAFVAKGAVVKAGRRQIFTRADLYAEGDAGALKLIASGETILLSVEDEAGGAATAQNAIRSNSTESSFQ